MKMKKLWMAGLLSLSLAGSSLTVNAEEPLEAAVRETSWEDGARWQGENPASNETITAMDEYGNVTEVTVGNGYVEEGAAAAYARVGGGEIVNFNIGQKKSELTTYEEEGTGANGYINGYYGADAAYLGREGGRVKFLMSGVVGFVDESKVQIIRASSAKSVSHYKVTRGKLIHHITFDMNQTGYAGSLNNGTAPAYLEEGRSYYSYDGHYFYEEEKFGEMLEDYQAGNRSRSVNASAPFYNYFQYLPLRSRTNLGSSLNGILNGRIENITKYDGTSPESSKLYDTGDIFLGIQKNYGVNALLAAGIAANESRWGTSEIAQTKNNLFGLNAVDSSPGESADKFAGAAHCIEEFADIWMSKGYLYPADWRYYGGFLGNKASGINVKYASDPYWGEKAAGVAWNLNADGSNVDAGVYTIGIKGVVGNPYIETTVYSEASEGSAALYRTGSQSDTSYILLDANPENGFYKIQNDAILNVARDGITKNGADYNYDRMYAYIRADAVGTVISGNGNINLGEGMAFADVYPELWYYDYVRFVHDRGIMTGMTPGYFGASENLSRAHFATVLYRMEGSPDVAYSSRFPDVPDGQFYTKPALWGAKSQIINGYDSGGFGPGDDITREQLVTMMYRYAGYKGYHIPANGDLKAFPDAAYVSDFAKEAMQWAVGAGIITGDNEKINPQGSASRAHCAAIIQRFIGMYES